MNFNQPEGTIVKIETRGEMRKRKHREQNAASRAENNARASKIRKESQSIGCQMRDVPNQPRGTIVVETETRGEMRKRKNREQTAARRAEEHLSRECHVANASVPLRVRIMDNNFQEATKTHTTWP